MRAHWEYHCLDEARTALAGRMDRACQPVPFDRIDWLDGLVRHCLPDTRLRILRAAEGDAEAWLFLHERAPGHLAALANWYSFSWNPIFLNAPDPGTQRRLLTAAIGQLNHSIAHIDLFPTSVEDGPDGNMADLTAAAFRRAGWFAVRRPFGGNYILDVEGDFATYWAARPGALRELVRRKGRTGRFALSITDSLTDADWRDYEAVHAQSWKEPEHGMAFLREFATAEAAAGTLRLGFARDADGRAVAAQLWTVDHGIAYIHKLAHDRALDAASPGTLLSHALFAHVIDRDRVRRIDYGTGDNGYKTEWMNRRRILYRMDCFNPRFASTWLPAARTAISKLVG